MSFAAAAEIAGSARRHQRQDNAISLVQIGDSWSDLSYDTGSLVTEHNGQWLWYHPITHM